jgi:hypothetical protein
MCVRVDFLTRFQLLLLLLLFQQQQQHIVIAIAIHRLYRFIRNQ